MPKTWRLLDYGSSDPKVNLAVNEAIFRSRYEGLSRDTLHLWQCGRSVIFGGQALTKKMSTRKNVENTAWKSSEPFLFLQGSFTKTVEISFCDSHKRSILRQEWQSGSIGIPNPERRRRRRPERV